MTNVNIPAIASAAFLGFLALAALLFCVPPVTRFLGDLLCCPWRIPFTRKRRRNDDEEVDKEDLPYLAERRASTPADDAGYQSMPDTYMSVHGELGTAGGSFRDGPSRMNYNDGPQGFDEVYYGGSYNDHHAPLPLSHSRDWWRSPSDEYPECRSYTEHPDPEYPDQATRGYDQALHYSDEDNYGYDKDTFSGPDIRRPQPSYSPPEMISHQYTSNYFPQIEQEYYSQYRRP